MILITGHGYVGAALLREMERIEVNHVYVAHGFLDGFWKAHEVIKTIKPDVVINCAAFIPKESVALCDKYPQETLMGNVVFPIDLCRACEDQGVTFAHISTGCLWSDGKVHSEVDTPQRSFTGHCGFYIGTKVLAETAVQKTKKHYIWRIRLPFDEVDGERNYLSKLMHFKTVWKHTNSISHLVDFSRACLETIRLEVPFGVYNVTNEGSISAVSIVEKMLKLGLLKSLPEFIDQNGGDCQCDISKLTSCGITMRHCEEAVDEALRHWS